MTLVRTMIPPDCCVLDELESTLDCSANEGLTDRNGEPDCTNDEEGFSVLVKILVVLLVIVDSFTDIVVGAAFGTLAVTVMWIVDVCASGPGRRPGSKMMGSTNAFCMLDNVTADMVVIGISEGVVDRCADGWAGRVVR
jgi:hypothetical protein